ncbi:hypothetical protein M231_00305 [Tremella mesenterica]|uniref:Kinesin motor domain-containing protein n=1 Tax=Tremella mesenterica TaxID=5217 RepID=A0A4Q1BVZ4_TREME|nr:hypothetical protein M231_00305 [Tremella mesenterica]
MSRRPPNHRVPSRSASSVSLAMPPPARIPNRAPSVMSTTQSHEESESRPSTPRKAGKRPMGPPARKEEGSGEINIQVVVRCRGRSPQELAQTSPIIVTAAGAMSKHITVETTPLPSSTLAAFTTASTYAANGASTKTYPFDKVFGPEADQTMVFNEVAEDMLNEVLSGYNCTIFAYGQTGTGKTYTMQGDLELSPLSAPKNEAGIVPRVLHRLFTLLEAAENTEYSVKCSYVELYNEELRDLLSADYSPLTAAEKAPMASSSTAGGLKLYEDGKKGVMIQGLEETGARNLREALALVNKGCQRRQVAETKMNTESSRSHTIFSITVHVKETTMAAGGEEMLKVGKFNLVDLAGSEAIGRSGATDKRAREAGMINQSLLTLGRVISALVEKGSHIPYRESKLTRLLQDSLGGRTKTCIVATVSPTRSNMEETLSTLDYAIRAKSIRNRPELNQHLTKAGLLKEYVADMERLKGELLAAREKNGIYIPEEQWKEMHEEQVKMKSEYDEARQRFNAISIELNTRKKEFDDVMHRFLSTSEELAQARESERQLGMLLVENKKLLDVAQQRLAEEVAVSEAYRAGESRLDGVAALLRNTANDGVADVGGLFDKLSRKAKVLGNNTDAATRFGGEVQNLSTELRKGLKTLHKVNGEFGKDVKKEMEGFMRNGRETSGKDMEALDQALSVFTTLTDELCYSVRSGDADVAEASRAILAVKDEVQQSVRQWAQGIAERSAGMVDEVLASQQENLSMIGLVLQSTADLVDAVISTAREHLASSLQIAEQARQRTQEAAEAEMARLRSSNVLLTTLLREEKTKTAKLRMELVGRMTAMIEEFTDAQDQSWSGVVDRVSAENHKGVREMERFVQVTRDEWEETAKRGQMFEDELAEGVGTVKKQRVAGRGAVHEMEVDLKNQLNHFRGETSEEATRHSRDVQSRLTGLDTCITDLVQSSSSRTQTQTHQVSSISGLFTNTISSSRSRIESVAGETERLSHALLSHQASSSSTFDHTSREAQNHLQTLLQATSTFLSKGVTEDVSTGITPKKRNWHVPQTWELTEPREVLIEAFRKKTQSALTSSTGESEEKEDGAEEKSLEEEIKIDRIDSTGSLHSFGKVELAVELVHPLSNSIGLGAVGRKGKLGIGKEDKGMGMGREKERVNVAVLGEQGGNIPRPRVRR